MKQNEYTYNMVFDAVNNSKTQAEAAEKLGRRGQYGVLKKLITKFDIDISHFNKVTDLRVPRVEKTCPVCKKIFTILASVKQTTCSHACSNTYFRHGKTPQGFQYKTDEYLIERGDYRQVCFRYHQKQCIICGEKNIVAVHHLDENHENHSPDNLIPLCPTHHQYCHSEYKSLIEEKVNEYISNFKLSMV